MNKWFDYVHEGYAKHPCTQSVCTLGFAVRSIRPYRCVHGRLQGGPLYTLGREVNKQVHTYNFGTFISHFNIGVGLYLQPFFQ